MRRAWDLLTSVRLTIALLVSIVLLFLVSLGVPQRQVLQQGYEAWRSESPGLVTALESLGLTDVHRSPLAAALWALFFVNLAAVLVRRAPAIRARTKIETPVPDPTTALGFTYRKSLPAPQGGALTTAAPFLSRRGFALHVADGRLRAVRNRWAPWATIVFHLSFFVVAAGAAASFYTRFEGMVDLGAGEEFTGALDQYASISSMARFGRPPTTRFTVESISPEVVGDLPVGVRVDLRDAQMLRRTIEVNRPYEDGAAAFVFKNMGVAPLLRATDVDGNELFGGFVRLNVLQGRSDRFELLGQSFQAELFPDYVAEGSVERSASQEMRNPVLRLTVKVRSGREVRGSLHPGDALRLGPYLVHFDDWRYWVRLYVRSERGLSAVWLGFGCAALALVVRLLFFRRELVAAEVEGGLEVAGRADYYTVLFADEADALMAELEAALGDAAKQGLTAPA